MAVLFPKVVIGILVAIIPLPHSFALTHWNNKVKVSADRMHQSFQPSRKLQFLDGCNLYADSVETGFSEYNMTCASCVEDSTGFSFECSEECSECYTYENTDSDGTITICSRLLLYSQQFDFNGNLTGLVLVEQVTKGDGNVWFPVAGTEIRYEDDFAGNCEYSIDGDKCTSCTYCEGSNDTEFASLLVDCSNVVPESIMNDCTETFTGLFEYYKANESEIVVDCDLLPLDGISTTTAETTTAATAATTTATTAATTTIATDSGSSATAETTTIATDSGATTSVATTAATGSVPSPTSSPTATDTSGASTAVRTWQLLVGSSILCLGFFM